MLLDILRDHYSFFLIFQDSAIRLDCIFDLKKRRNRALHFCH
jgi:hypothetical protein